MRRLNVFIALFAAVVLPLAALTAATPAMAYNVSTVYRDCEANGELTGHYSRAELQAALGQIPSQMAEYSDCQDIIQRALLAASKPTAHHNGSATAPASGGNSGGRGGGKGSGKRSSGRGGKSRAASTRKGALGRPAGSNASSLAVAGIHPGTSSRSLPAALLVVLILLALTAVSGGAVAIRRRVVARHGT
jgi:hypothetical protein